VTPMNLKCANGHTFAHLKWGHKPPTTCPKGGCNAPVTQPKDRKK
jgi:hypothetical protein